MSAKLIVAPLALIPACECTLVANSRVGSTRRFSDSNSKLSAEARSYYGYTERIPRHDDIAGPQHLRANWRGG